MALMPLFLRRRRSRIYELTGISWFWKVVKDQWKSLILSKMHTFITFIPSFMFLSMRLRIITVF